MYPSVSNVVVDIKITKGMSTSGRYEEVFKVLVHKFKVRVRKWSSRVSMKFTLYRLLYKDRT